MKYTLSWIFALTVIAHSSTIVSSGATWNDKRSSLPECFFKPIEFSQSSITSFLKNTYNHPRYPQEFLALNFHHVVSGIKLAHKSTEPRRFIRRMLSLFTQKVHNIYVNPYAFTDLLIQLLPTLEPYSKAVQKQEKIEAIKELVSSCLVDNFSDLKNNPDETLEKLSHDIFDLVDEQQDATVREVQHSLNSFLARAVMRLVWSAQDGLETWQSFKTVGALLEKYFHAELIDEEMLNDLFWLLIRQYSYFISLCGSNLNQEYYDAVGHDLQEAPETLWMHEESEAYITPKQEYLRSQLIESALTSRMCALGHVLPNS